MNKEVVEDALTESFIIELYSEVEKKKRQSNGQYRGSCPFHKDLNPSFSFDPDPEVLGLYSCFSCNEAGNIYTYIKKIKKQEKPLLWLSEVLKTPPELVKPIKKQEQPKVILDEMILEAKKNLFFNNTKKVEELETMGIDCEVIKKMNLGFKNGRFWIPIKDQIGNFVNIRKYDPNAKGPDKVLSHKGFGNNRLWPIDNLNSDTIFLFEGEKDTLIALSLGLNAMTNTTGAGSWVSDWGKLFINKSVVICMDIDDAGQKGAKMRARNILPYASQVKIINLPLDKKTYENGDFADFIMLESFTKNDFLEIVEQATPLPRQNGGKRLKDDEEEYQVTLSEASKSHLIDKKCLIKNILVCGKEEQPFAVPKSIKAICIGPRNATKCKGCSLIDKDFNKIFKKYDDQLLSMIDIPEDIRKKNIKKSLEINNRCTENTFEINSYYNIERIRIAPGISYNIEEDFEQVYRNGYFVMDEGKFIQTNKAYSIKCLTTTDKKTSHVVHQIYDAQDSESNIDTFKLNKDMIKNLNKFRVKEGQSVQQKMGEIYNEFSELFRIYDRNDALALMDMVYHSALSFKFQGKLIDKGWSETAIIGDSSVGKSKQAERLVKHYRAGEMLSGEGAGYTGLVAAMSQHGNHWTLQWGALPLNDKRLVIIDETTGIKEEDIAKFSDIRSSGQAKILKVMTQKTRARTRIIWISNPRKQNLGIARFQFGVHVLRDVFGQPEDIRRLDSAIISAIGDVSEEVINRNPKHIIPIYDSNSCHNLIMFAWSRGAADILIPQSTESHILKRAMDMSKRYSSAIPLVDPADMRHKLARGSVATAIRVFNVNDDLKVIVDKIHVEYVFNLLDRIYSSSTFGYRRFSIQDKQRDLLKNEREVCKVLGLHEPYKIDELLNNTTISRIMLKDILSEDLSDFAQKPIIEKIRILQRNHAILSKSNYYVLLSGLNRLLKELKQWHEDGYKYDDFFDRKSKIIAKGVCLD